jgi:hypothetical protein
VWKAIQIEKGGLEASEGVVLQDNKNKVCMSITILRQSVYAQIFALLF